MTFMVYMWLFATVLIAVGGALLACGWWLDKAAGNHRRARCRKCWYSLEGAAAREDGTTLCPECGTVARRARDMHRVRRSWAPLFAGLVMVGAGLFLSGRPYLQNGGWLYLLPRSMGARLWAWAGAEQYGREVRMRVAQGIATDAEIDSVAGGAKALVLRAVKSATGMITSDVEAAFASLSKQGADPEVEKAACALMLQPGPFYSRPAIAYLDAMKVPMKRRVELAAPLLKGTAGPPVEYFEMLAASKDPDALAELVRASLGSGMNANFAKSRLIEADVPGLLAICTAFRDAKTDSEREELWTLFEGTAPFHYGIEVVPFVEEVGALPVFSERAKRAAGMYSGRIKLSVEQVKAMLASDNPVQIAMACRGAEQLPALPEGCGVRILHLRDGGDAAMTNATQQLIYKFAGPDRLLWIPRLKEGGVESRREACFVIRNMTPVLQEAVPVLRGIEASPAESEEMRVAARDALRQMGEGREGAK